MWEKVIAIVLNGMIIVTMVMTFSVASAHHHEDKNRNYGCPIFFASGIECPDSLDKGVARVYHFLALREMVQSIVTNDNLVRAITVIFLILVAWWHLYKSPPLFIKQLRFYESFRRLGAVSLAMRRRALFLWVAMHIRDIPSAP